MTSGKDTNVIGSTVKGDRVIANVGGNLYIQSLQDKETYVGKQKNTGFSVSTNGTQLGSISGEHSKGDMRSNYASVTEQAGIFAGKDGYTITTKGTTTLEGAIIDSKAAAEKNTVSTGRLAMKDIENTAEYSSKNTGVSYNHIGNFKSLSQAGQDAVYNSLGLLPKLLPESKDSAHSTTKSAIADGTITVHDESVDIRSISRDTVNSLNKLDKIFDKKKVEERQELARLFAKDAFEQLHYWEPKTKEEKVAKAIAHGVVAEVSARVAGNKPGSGFYAGVTNEALIGEIQKVAKTNPAVAQWLSAGVGAVVNAGLGKPANTGAAEAQYGTKWNATGTIKESDDLKGGEFINIIVPPELNGTEENQAFLRSRWGDMYLPYGVLPGEYAVIQFSKPGSQSRGQEVIINSDRSYSNVEKSLGLVKSVWDKNSGYLSNQEDKSSTNLDWLNIKPTRNLKATWFEKSSGRYYNEYDNGDIEPTDRYRGIEFLQQGYPLERVTYNNGGSFYYISNGYYVPDVNETKAAIDKAETEFVLANMNDLAGGGRGGSASINIGKFTSNLNNVAKYQLRSIVNIPSKSFNSLPTHVSRSYSNYKNINWQGNYSGQTPGTAAGRRYANRDNQLPNKDTNGNAITYKEYDVNNYTGPIRDSERFVRGSDGSVYYTDNHYKSFIKID